MTIIKHGEHIVGIIEDPANVPESGNRADPGDNLRERIERSLLWHFSGVNWDECTEAEFNTIVFDAAADIEKLIEAEKRPEPDPWGKHLMSYVEAGFEVYFDTAFPDRAEIRDNGKGIVYSYRSDFG
jgi:hypothetical protein